MKILVIRVPTKKIHAFACCRRILAQCLAQFLNLYKEENIVLILAKTFFLSHFHCYIYRVASLFWLDSELGAFQENILLFRER